MPILLAAGGISNALLEGQKIGATTIQLFTSNQKRWVGKTFTDVDIQLWQETLKATGLKKIMSHGSYLINFGSPDLKPYKSRHAFKEEFTRCHQLGIVF